MFWGYNRFMWTLRNMTKSRILVGLLCLSFLVLSVKVVPESCNALERESPHMNHLPIVPGINWNLSSMPRLPHGNQCSCSLPGGGCCMGPINSTPKNSHVSLFYRDNLRPVSILQATMMKPFDHKPLNLKDRCFHNFNSFNEKAAFLANCTLLI
jgi:hypothetical protein